MTPTAALLSGTREAAKLLGVRCGDRDARSRENRGHRGGSGRRARQHPGDGTPDFRDVARAGDRARKTGEKSLKPGASRDGAKTTACAEPDLMRSGAFKYTARPSPNCRRVRGAAGSTPRGVAQPGRALRSGRIGRRFKSCHPDQLSQLLKPSHPFTAKASRALEAGRSQRMPSAPISEGAALGLTRGSPRQPSLQPSQRFVT